MDPRLDLGTDDPGLVRKDQPDLYETLDHVTDLGPTWTNRTDITDKSNGQVPLLEGGKPI